jgi:glycosyltransferase involved in cell wall biosynthesis
MKLSYRDYELLFVDVHHNGETLRKIYEEFKDKLPIRYLHLNENFCTYAPGYTTWTPATTWNYGIEKAEGKFVIITGGDIILSYPDMIERFLVQYNGRRNSVLIHFLSHAMVNALSGIDWSNNPESIQSLPGYWDDIVDDITNRSRTIAGHTTYLTGQTKADWEWIGKFRTELGHLVNDQDLVIRENAIGKNAGTLDSYIAFHQAHPIESKEKGVPSKQSIVKHGYLYYNEAQARLLEPAPQDPD